MFTKKNFSSLVVGLATIGLMSAYSQQSKADLSDVADSVVEAADRVADRTNEASMKEAVKDSKITRVVVKDAEGNELSEDQVNDLKQRYKALGAAIDQLESSQTVTVRSEDGSTQAGVPMQLEVTGQKEPLTVEFTNDKENSARAIEQADKFNVQSVKVEEESDDVDPETNARVKRTRIVLTLNGSEVQPQAEETGDDESVGDKVDKSIDKLKKAEKKTEQDMKGETDKTEVEDADKNVSATDAPAPVEAQDGPTPDESQKPAAVPPPVTTMPGRTFFSPFAVDDSQQQQQQQIEEVPPTVQVYVETEQVEEQQQEVQEQAKVIEVQPKAESKYEVQQQPKAESKYEVQQQPKEDRKYEIQTPQSDVNVSVNEPQTTTSTRLEVRERTSREEGGSFVDRFIRRPLRNLRKSFWR